MAATVHTNDRSGVSGKGKGPATRQNLGIFTPEGTPTPEDARIEADKARQQAELSQAAQGQPPTVATQSKPSYDDESEDGPESENEDSNPPSQEQIDAVQKVLACGQKEYRKILGVNDAYTDPKKEQEDIMNAFRKLGMLTNPDYNKAKKSEEAFRSKFDFVFAAATISLAE
jgi:hypothetical protein